MNKKALLLVFVIVSILLIPVGSAASPEVSITYTQLTLNSYSVVFTDSQNINVTIFVMIGGVVNSTLDINRTTTQVFNVTQNTTLIAMVAGKQVASIILPYVSSSSSKMNIVLLLNDTYQITYFSPTLAYLIVNNVNNTRILNRSVEGNGSIFISPQLNPGIAVLTKGGVAEVILNFPVAVTRNITNVTNKYYVGVPIEYVILMGIIIGIAVMIGMFFIENGRAQVKRHIATNKDDTLIDRFKTQEMTNVEYKDPNLLVFLTNKFTAMDSLLKRTEELEKHYQKLLEQEQNRRGGE
jgi:hypothetical protein